MGMSSNEPPMKVTIEVERPDGTIHRTTYHRAIDIETEIAWPPPTFARSHVLIRDRPPTVILKLTALDRADGEQMRHEIITPDALCGALIPGDVGALVELLCLKPRGHQGRHRGSDDVGRVWWDR